VPHARGGLVAHASLDHFVAGEGGAVEKQAIRSFDLGEKGFVHLRAARRINRLFAGVGCMEPLVTASCSPP